MYRYKDKESVEEDRRGVWPAQGGLVVRSRMLSPRRSSINRYIITFRLGVFSTCCLGVHPLVGCLTGLQPGADQGRMSWNAAGGP